MQRAWNYLRKIPREWKVSQSPRGEEPYESADADYPTFPQPPHKKSWQKVSIRKYCTPRGEFEDSSLYALYRIYEYIVLVKLFAYRSNLEWYWWQHQWPVCDIPDPQDPDPARYAFLAGVTYLMVRASNVRVALGLTRDAPPGIMRMDEVEEARKARRASV